MNNKTTSSRLIHFDCLRVLACISVILIHVAANLRYESAVPSFSWYTADIYNFFVRFSVPAFVMISGVFFLDPNKNYTIESILKKHCFRIVCAYLFWAIAYETFFCLISKHPFTTIQNFFLNVVNGCYHLWFLYMILGLYLSTPILRAIANNKKLMQYFLVVWLVSATIKIITDIFFFDQLPSFYFSGIMIIGYSGYFVLGYYINSYSISTLTKRTIYILATVSLIASIIVSVICKDNDTTNTIENYLLFTTVFETAAIFIFFKEHVSKFNFTPTASKIIYTLSKYSFGIYLVHIFVLFIVQYSVRKLDFINPIVSIPLITVLVFGGSFISAYFIGKIPVLKKYII